MLWEKLKFLILLIAIICLRVVDGQGPHYPNHWYGTELVKIIQNV